jgi:hypothetical protein
MPQNVDDRASYPVRIGNDFDSGLPCFKIFPIGPGHEEYVFIIPGQLGKPFENVDHVLTDPGLAGITCE